jgi:hypothetical protein
MKNCTPRHLRRLLLGLGLCCCITTASAQNFEWAKSIHGQDYGLGSAITVDSSGNTYIGGTFTGNTADFDPGPGAQNLTATGWDMFLLKLDAAGNFVWVKHFVGSDGLAFSGPNTIAVDNSGNIYIEGFFGTSGGTIDFDPGSGVFNMGTGTNGQNTDIFVTKLNASGTFVWAKQLGGDDQDQSSSMSLDQSGNILITGYFKGTADFNPGTGVNNLTAVNSSGDAFIAKLDPNGDYLWAKSMGTADGGTRTQSIQTDMQGNVYTMGTFQGTIDADPGAGVQNMVTEQSPSGWSVINAFISKLDANGNYVWAKNTGAPYNINSTWISPQSMSVDGFGNIYATGAFTDSIDFDPGPGTDYLVSASAGSADIYISKWDTTGNYQWTKGIGGSENELGWRIKTDKYGNSYTYGAYYGPTDFDPSDMGIYEIIPATAQGGIFVTKLDSTGSFKWARAVDGAGSLEGTGIAVSPSASSVHLTSSFSGTVDFDPGINTANLTGNSDIFVLKLGNCIPLSATINATACEHYSLNGTTYTASGSYHQSYVTANGCDSTITLELVIHAKPDAVITQAGNILSATASGASYQWIDCGNGNSIINGATAQSFTATSNGSYAVILTQNGCSDTSDCRAVTGLSIQEPGSINNISVYPNPANDHVTLTSSLYFHNAVLNITNIMGQYISGQKSIKGNTVYINMASLIPGIYILEVTEAGKTYRAKVVKE